MADRSNNWAGKIMQRDIPLHMFYFFYSVVFVGRFDGSLYP